MLIAVIARQAWSPLKQRSTAKNVVVVVVDVVDDDDDDAFYDDASKDVGWCAVSCPAAENFFQMQCFCKPSGQACQRLYGDCSAAGQFPPAVSQNSFVCAMTPTYSDRACLATAMSRE